MPYEIMVLIVNLAVSALVGFVVASFKIGTYKEKVDTAKTDIKELKTEMKEIRDKVIACETSLKEREPLIKRKSPITLSERGEKVLKESGGQKFIDDNFTKLFGEVEQKNPKTAYDIQELSKDVISPLTDNDDFIPIKNYLFDEGLNLENVVEVLSVHLRDKILKEKNWNIDDIDKNDPAKTDK